VNISFKVSFDPHRDAISSVYDHSIFEDDGGKLSWEQRQMREQAKTIVADAVDHLQRSGGAVSRPRFGTAASIGGGVSSASLLGSLRANTSSNGTASNRGGDTSKQLSFGVDILSRLKRLFDVPGSAYATNEIIARFSDVGDQHAVMFREMLRNVAQFSDGKWKKK